MTAAWAIIVGESNQSDEEDERNVSLRTNINEKKEKDEIEKNGKEMKEERSRSYAEVVKNGTSDRSARKTGTTEHRVRDSKNIGSFKIVNEINKGKMKEMREFSSLIKSNESSLLRGLRVQKQ